MLGVLITSRVSGRGNRIGPVFPSVCLSVCEHSHHAHGRIVYVFVNVSQSVVRKGLLGKRTECTFGECWGYVNAQVFLLFLK